MTIQQKYYKMFCWLEQIQKTDKKLSHKLYKSTRKYIVKQCLQSRRMQ